MGSALVSACPVEIPESVLTLKRLLISDRSLLGFRQLP